MLWWGRLLRKKKRDAPRFEEGFQARAQHLNKILERERTRTDRTGRPLSMVLIGYDGRKQRHENVETIVQVMRKRARITDEIGWFNKSTAFAVLTDTPAVGGRRFAQIVRQQLDGLGVPTSFALYQYASPVDHDDPGPGPGQGGSRHQPADSLPEQHQPKREPVHALAMAGGQLEGFEDEFSEHPAHALGPLLAHGLPWWKRATDVAVAGSALAMLWPVLLALGVAIKLDSKGPMIFKQKRSGLAGRPFGIWKFRTMGRDAEAERDALLSANEQDGPAFKIKADPRITRLGALLRKTSLDELPQLINILRGEMTLVGPRPLPIFESDACEPWQKRRLDITPGLTCIWQVWGRSGVSFNEWIRMDLRYQRQRTPAHDLKIMLATVPAVLKQRGAC